MTKYLVIDVEGPLDSSPFNPYDRLSLIGLFDGSVCSCFNIEYDSAPYGEAIKQIQALVDMADVLIAFNSKYDLHWLRRYGIKFHHKKLWCLQYAEFCMSGQSWPYPDLDTSCKKRGLAGKSTYLWDTYWSKGIDTMFIPYDDLVAYNKVDLLIEWNLFQEHRKYLEDRGQLKKLIWYGCQDLLITEEMEWSGMKYDMEKSIRVGNTLLQESQNIVKELNAIINKTEILQEK